MLKKEDYENLLFQLENQLENSRSKNVPLAERAKTLALNAIIKHIIYANNYNVSRACFSCISNLDDIIKDVTIENKLSSAITTQIQSMMFKQPKKQQDLLDTYLALIISSYTGDTIEEKNLQEKLADTLLEFRIKVDITLEKLVRNMDIIAQEIQAILFKTQGIDLFKIINETYFNDSPITNLSTMLINGVKLQYGTEENRDDKSTKAIDKYKDLLAQCIYPDILKVGKPPYLSTLIAEVDVKNITIPSENQTLFDLAKKLNNLDQEYGASIQVCGNIYNLAKSMNGDEENYIANTEILKQQLYELKKFIMPDIVAVCDNTFNQIVNLKDAKKNQI